MPTAIEFNHVSKQYRLGLVSTKTLSHDLDRWWKMNILGKEDPYLKIGETNDRATKGVSDYVWALKDIDFKVEQGDVVGIIGKNGAGKSTLLKLLSKVTGPTTGSIKARGRIGALLEVGTGFHSEMTGRENIFLNGAILGMSKQEVTRKLDEIVDFSGCERYLDTPVKRYSSGMLVRLGFAVAAHLDPEILVVDEVLAVGDAEFQKKAIGKMQDVSKGEGRTVLFVSHNMESIRRLCTIGILLQNGMLEYTGNIQDVIHKYQKENNSTYKPQWINLKNRICENITVNAIKLIDSSGNVIDSDIHDGDELFVNLSFDLSEVSSDLSIGVSIFNEKGYLLYRILDVDHDSTKISKTGHIEMVTKLETDCLQTGIYNVVFDASHHSSNWIVNPYSEKEMIVSFHKDQTFSFSSMHFNHGIISPNLFWEPHYKNNAE